MSLTELAWAAGFFDGEGWSTCTTTTQTARYHYPQIGVSQKDKRVLDRFLVAVNGIGSITSPKGTSPCWVWRVTGTKAAQVMAFLWPYLSEPKKEQWEEVLRRTSRIYPGRTNSLNAPSNRS